MKRKAFKYQNDLVKDVDFFLLATLESLTRLVYLFQLKFFAKINPFNLNQFNYLH